MSGETLWEIVARHAAQPRRSIEDVSCPSCAEKDAEVARLRVKVTEAEADAYALGDDLVREREEVSRLLLALFRIKENSSNDVRVWALATDAINATRTAVATRTSVGL